MFYSIFCSNTKRYKTAIQIVDEISQPAIAYDLNNRNVIIMCNYRSIKHYNDTGKMLLRSISQAKREFCIVVNY